jgi:hypothetical protein
MARKPTSTFELLLKRIEGECIALKKKDERESVAAKVRYNQALITDFLRVRKDLEALEKALDKAGLAVTDTNTFQLTFEERGALDDRYAVLLRRFREMRSNLLIQWPIATAEQRDSMLKYFYKEVAATFPTLAKTILPK